ncbi:SDR family oxidoreductase [Solirubrobacter phytolaccae]|uniref:SDR family oxidoreductase n=1 Tax=Solirubrobacter phytolaccae TaxID=1404360 RepID=A0A9X3SBJ5_9ACTN|nr:SDR family oxidoreductase [Solirubrobacter phytolaccae]MDA0183681.1 SDR family oxidoreductase [Solirubrobacter phytolaccae]
MTDIKNRVVAITGASSGIGEATAGLLAERGAKVVLGARREDRLRALAEELGGAYAVTDVSKREDVQRLVDVAQERFGRLDVLVSNAGVMPIGPFDDLDVDAWERMVDVNVKGVLFGIAAALPVFRAQGEGHFVTTASTAAYRVVPSQAVYAGTKAAVRMICEGLRQEADGTVRVTTVSPGFVHTDSPGHVSNPAVREQIREARDRMAIPPDAIARAIAFALEQPGEVDVNEIVVRPTAQT